MATRMQQRRGTASQWTSANPILAAGEIGYETDTNKFKIGDGTTAWGSLSYFINAADLIDGAPALLDTMNEIAAAIGDDANFITTVNNSLDERITFISKTSAEWNTDNDVLAIGEFGIITDTTPAIVKSGDGVTAFTSLVALANTDVVLSAINELTQVNTDLTQVTADLTQTTADLAAHSLLTTNVHGIVDTSALLTSSDLATIQGDLSDLSTSIAGLTTDLGTVQTDITALEADKLDATTAATTYAPLASPTFTGTVSLPSDTAIGGITSTELGILDGLTVTTAELNTLDGITASTVELNILDGATLTTTELNHVDGVTSAIQTQLDAKAPSADPTFTGTVNAADIVLTGNLTVGGTTTTVNATDLVVTDPLIYIGEDNAGNSVDLGLVASFNDGSYQHTGLARDASDNKWKLFSSVEDEPTTTINFAQATYDTLVVGGIEYSDGLQSKQGVPSLTSINAQTASYTGVLTDRDKLVEINSSSATTFTIPLNSSVAYPVGTSFDVLQTGSGQVTIAGAAGVTVNSTPGLKLRTQWSSATLFKRAEDTWVVFGDLTA